MNYSYLISILLFSELMESNDIRDDYSGLYLTGYYFMSIMESN